MLGSMFTVPMVIQNAGPTKDRYNRPNADWSSPTSTSVFGWYDTSLRRMHENIVERDAAEADAICFLPGDAPVQSTSRIIIDGTTYQVLGIPAVIRRPGSGIHHLECRMQRFQG